jgi:hypothetical protein
MRRDERSAVPKDHVDDDADHNEVVGHAAATGWNVENGVSAQSEQLHHLRLDLLNGLD